MHIIQYFVVLLSDIGLNYSLFCLDAQSLFLSACRLRFKSSVIIGGIWACRQAPSTIHGTLPQDLGLGSGLDGVSGSNRFARAYNRKEVWPLTMLLRLS